MGLQIPRCGHSEVSEKDLYTELRKYLGRGVRNLARQKESRVREGAFDEGSRVHLDFDPAEIFGVAGDRLCQGQKRDPFGPGLR
jgi:hypothetical protein